jgi:hypothetical protein
MPTVPDNPRTRVERNKKEFQKSLDKIQKGREDLLKRQAAEREAQKKIKT